MISEKNDRVLGSSGSSNTAHTHTQHNTEREGTPVNVTCTVCVLARLKRKEGTWLGKILSHQRTPEPMSKGIWYHPAFLLRLKPCLLAYSGTSRIEDHEQYTFCTVHNQNLRNEDTLTSVSLSQ